VWRPRTYDEADAAVGGVSESDDLDFKRELGSSEGSRKELAKDVAAMTINGGVIVIGMDETDGLASALTPISLAGVPERIQQLIDSRIRPVPAVEIDVLRTASTDTDGLIVVEIPPSRFAPHYANEKFPRRSGRVTDYMSERDVEMLYEQRRRLTERGGEVGPSAGYVVPEGSQDSRPGGLGVLRLLVHPFSGVAPMGSPRLAEPLDEAVAAAESAVGPLLAGEPHSFDSLRRWKPRSTVGWKAGRTSDVLEEHRDQVLVAATYSYTGQLSFQVSMNLEPPGGPPGRRAWEPLWALETVALLAIAGHFYAAIPGVGLVRVALSLGGLAGAIAWMPVHGSGATDELGGVTDDYYTESIIVSPRALWADPVPAARELLDRFFVSFIDHRIDVFERVVREPSA
jgi:hypothetical protein